MTRGFETTEFRHAFHRETDRLMRRRLIWFIAIWGGLGVLGFVGVIINSIPKGGLNWAGITGLWPQVVFGVLGTAWVAAYAAGLLLVLGRLLGRHLQTREIVRLSIALIVIDGLFFVACRALGISGYNLFWFWVSHLVACAVFPWRVREALVPIAIVLPVSVVAALTIEGTGWEKVLARTLILLISLMPAVFLCWYKHSQRLVRASNRFLHQRYGMLRQELAYARQVHEALFPAPLADGPVRFTYKYEPMRQIGGDYLHAHVCEGENGALSVVVLDVTGHGIPAALTVNRLHGELDLRFADNPDIGPGEILRCLNRYVNLTLARHSIYATALCLRIDPAHNVLTYASGGHPPGFMLASDATIRELGSTALVLGACRNEDYDPCQVELAFHPGDSLIVYTDGAVEARSPDGRMLRIAGFRDALLEATTRGIRPGLWPDHLLSLVANHRAGGPPEDDTLVVELHRPLRTPAPAPREPATASAG